MKNFHILPSIIFILLIIGCEQNDDDVTTNAPEDLVNESLQYFDGNVIGTQKIKIITKDQFQAKVNSRKRQG